MNIPKAIEIVNFNIKEAGKKMPPDVKSALSLLTEAGKRVLTQRQSPDLVIWELLPGEETE